MKPLAVSLFVLLFTGCGASAAEQACEDFGGWMVDVVLRCGEELSGQVPTPEERKQAVELLELQFRSAIKCEDVVEVRDEDLLYGVCKTAILEYDCQQMETGKIIFPTVCNDILLME